MLDYSMTIGGVDLKQEYGIIIEEINRPFLPKLRPRKVELPNRSGAYDYGAKWRDEISLDIKCGSIPSHRSGSLFIRCRKKRRSRFGMSRISII